ncbi:MAG: RNA polymerase sigma factor [Brevinematia bacterium]
METEAELIYRIICGDEDAFNELYKKYSKMLISFAYKYTKDIDTTADIVQETFIKLLENIKNYSSRGSFKSFILTICLNIIRDRKRKEKRDKTLVKEIYNTYDRNNNSYNTMMNEITSIIDNLPHREKEIILLRLEGYRIDEIAEIEKCSSRTIKRILKKVINKIKSNLGM